MLVGLDDDTRHHETRVLENGPAVAYSARGLYRTTYISPNVSRFLGYPAEMFLADPDFWADLIHPDDRDRVAAGIARLPECQRRSKISPPGRSKTSPLNVMRYAVLGGCPGSP